MQESDAIIMVSYTVLESSGIIAMLRHCSQGEGDVCLSECCGYTPPGRHPPPHGRRLLQRTVRILLECILVLFFFAHRINKTISVVSIQLQLVSTKIY